MGVVNPADAISVQLTAIRPVAPAVVELKLEKPPGFGFMPGQFVRFHQEDCVRDYTLISTPATDSLDLCIALIDGGRFSQRIAAASVGDRFRITGPHGHFIFQESGRAAVFVATGTGVAPFVAYCRAGVRDALLLHGVRRPADLVYSDLLRTGLRSYIPCISRLSELPEAFPGAVAGRVTRYLEGLLPPGAYDFYLCGRREMIRDVTALIDRRFGDARLFIETYD